MSEANILIVEDESIIAMDIRLRLLRFGYTVCGIVATGEEAVRKCGEVLPDLVLMDIKLKGEMDGIDAASEIHRRFNVPVVYLTSLSDDATQKRAMATKPIRFIKKPFSDKGLQAAVEDSL
jgi:CheY-like chemotaxis protein